MSVTINFRGAEGLTNKLRELAAQNPQRAKTYVHRAGAFVMRDIQKNRVPIDTGALRASGDFRTEKIAKQYRAILYFTAAYALFVHENLEAAHGAAFNAKHGSTPGQRLRGVGQQAKFLERGIVENMDELRRMLAEDFRVDQ